MSFILDYRKALIENTSDKDLVVVVGGVNCDSESSEEIIMAKSFKPKYRLNASHGISNLQVQVRNPKSGASIIWVALDEFPACCGKLIIHHVGIYTLWSTTKEIITLSNKAVETNVKLTLEFIHKVCHRLHYSSFDLIVSEVDQPDLFKVMRKIEKPVYTFNNYRMSTSRTCDNYSITVKNCEEFSK